MYTRAHTGGENIQGSTERVERPYKTISESSKDPINAKSTWLMSCSPRNDGELKLS